jgi:enoyl-CoA hydratase/carnithine racemase
MLIERDGAVAILTINRPERSNGWTPRVSSRYFALLRECAADATVRAVVLTGAGPTFCVGADVDMLDGLATGTDPRADRAKRASERTPSGRRETPMDYPLGFPKPIVAAINGACAGLGLAHALMCDVRIAAAGATFSTAFVRRGLIAEQGTSWLLPQLVGRGVAADLLLSGRKFPAEEALQLGVVNRVLPVDEVLAAAVAYAADLAANCSPSSMAVIKRELLEHPALPYAEAVRRERTLMFESWDRRDFKEGVASFRERRPASFAPLAPGLASEFLEPPG